MRQLIQNLTTNEVTYLKQRGLLNGTAQRALAALVYKVSSKRLKELRLRTFGLNA